MFGITRAPDLDRAGLVWFNTDRPLGLQHLRGRVVVLDFWTLCCINCIHVLPTLRRLEEAFSDEVAVIGVHSPKFESERDPEAVRNAIARYDVRHPVAHDPHLILWEDYAVRAWPTLVFLSPDGFVIGQMSGEPDPDLLEQGIGDMLRQFHDQGEMRPQRLPLTPPQPSAGGLRYPGKIKPAPGSDKAWAVADGGHHQIVLLDDSGTELARYGSGRAGFEDGPADKACFNAPQGLVCTEADIFVADTGNHAVRRIHRKGGWVETLAGTGRRGPVLRQSQPAEGSALASPWDLEVRGDQILFANAGTHQIGLLDLTRGLVRPLAGSGGENIADGPALEALLAQPSGLTLSPDGRVLYFADSETSAIRCLRLEPEPRVETLVGSGLFDFGHRGGPFAQALMQHPLGLGALDGLLVVADSYNAALRLMDLGSLTVTDIEVDCADPVCLPLGELAGAVFDGPERILVSDTNNHRIVEVLLDQGISRSWAG